MVIVQQENPKTTMHMSGYPQQPGPSEDTTGSKSFAVFTNRSIFTRLIRLERPYTMLEEQYRTYRSICRILSDIYCRGKLETGNMFIVIWDSSVALVNEWYNNVPYSDVFLTTSHMRPSIGKRYS